MRDLNCVSLSGTVTNEPEMAYTQGAAAVCTFRIAVNNNNQDETPDVVYIGVSCFRAQAESVQVRLKVGDYVIIQGKLRMQETDGRFGRRKVYHISASYVKIQAKVEVEGGSRGTGNQEIRESVGEGLPPMSESQE